MKTLKLNKLAIAFMLCATVVVLFSCGKEEGDGDSECTTEALTYTNSAKSIIDTNCATSGCHNEGTTSTFQMHNFETVSAVVSFGNVLKSINHEPGVSQMPKGGTKLDDCTISKITAWINDGAPE